jgi:TonB family protein
MKNIFNMLVLAIVLFAAQACGPKEEKTETATIEATPEVKSPEVIAKEKRARIEKRRMEIAKDSAVRAEKRKIAFEERIKVSPTFTDASGDIVYHKAEVDPSFDGGKKAMMKYLRDNIKFPASAEEKELEGTVFVDFVVSSNGTVREVEVMNTPDEAVDQSFRDEAIRVVSAMPKWIPGRQHGKAVHVKYSLPISFQMI